MKASISAFILLFYCFCLKGQEVEDIIEFQLNTTTDTNEKIKILDASDDYVIVRVRSNDFSTSNGFLFQNEEADEVLLFCDASLNVLWRKVLIATGLHDAIIGSDAIYLYSYGNSGGGFFGEDLGLERSTFVAKMNFDGEWEWINQYGGLQRHWQPDRSLALDGEENLILASGLWNYEHPAPADTLVFMSDTCYCSAIDLQFPMCTTTLKWDSDGNELAYHILDSGSYCFTTGIGADLFGNYYVSGSLNHWIDLPIFAGTQISGGEFVLKFGPDNSEQWVYNRSNQFEGYNSGNIIFIDGNEQDAFFSVRHNTNEVVTDGDTIVLPQPTDGPFWVSYQTVHVLDTETGALDTLDFLGHFGSFEPLTRLPNGELYAVTYSLQDFEHVLPPYAHTPTESERLILARELFGTFSEPVVFYDHTVQHVDNMAHNKLYLDLESNQEPVTFGLNGITYTTLTEYCIVILDKVSNIQESFKASSKLEVFPNPALNGLFNLRSGFAMKRLRIFNVQGQLIHSEELNEQNAAQIDIFLKSGLYMVQVHGEGIVETRRLIAY